MIPAQGTRCCCHFRSRVCQFAPLLPCPLDSQMVEQRIGRLDPIVVILARQRTVSVIVAAWDVEAPVPVTVKV